MKKGYLYLLATALIFGSFEVVSKTITGIAAPQINLLRFLFGGIVLYPFALAEIKKKNIKFSLLDTLYLIGLGILLVPVSMVLLQTAIQNSSAALCAFIFSSNPVFIAIFAYFIIKEKPNKYVVMAIGIGIIGLIVIFNPFKQEINRFMLYAVIAALLFSLQIVFTRKAGRKFGSIVTITFVIIYGTAVLLIYFLIAGIPVFKGIYGGNIIQLLYIGIFCSGITYLCYYKGMELTSTNRGSIVFFLKPIIGTILAVIVLNEKLTVSFILGALLIVASSLLMVYGKGSNSISCRSLINEGKNCQGS